MSRKWVYGKQDWKTYERGQENCYLMTNGLGGFSSLTMTGSVARNDHAFLMACVKAPNNRYNMVHRLAEKLEISREEYVISSQEFADGSREDGFRYLSGFSYEDTPVWTFHVNGVEIRKEAAFKQGENTVVLSYRVSNRTRTDVRLSVTPFFQFTPKGSEPEPEQGFALKSTEDQGVWQIESNGRSLTVMADGEIEVVPEVSENYFYSYDACDGRKETGLAKACVRISADVKSGQEGKLSVVFSMERSCGAGSTGVEETVREIIEQQKMYRGSLADQAGFRDENARMLSKSAEQFVSLRESTGGKTILAGFPFFEDWGRDTMIALPGVCISTRRYAEAESILRTFAQYERNGLMPNLFPEGKNEPMYNTADAALLFINCVWLYYEATKDLAFAGEMYPVMERIIKAYKTGTDYAIHMDVDGLISAGSDLDQVTWMDVRVGEILPTPRHGKPVEINAYWYNALRIMEKFTRLLEREDRQKQTTVFSAEDYGVLAQRAQKSFAEKFWMEETHCLRDVLSDTKADTQIRCNQIWAVSMPFTMLDQAHEKQVVDTVFEKLYTPYGLRTLSMDDEEFHPVYTGKVLERDLAYHQGTVWTYPLGAYYLAYLKVHEYSEEAKQCVKCQLEAMESAMREGCIGQLPEIYDGENPVSSKGCFAQAWSVGEILRVCEELEK